MLVDLTDVIDELSNVTLNEVEIELYLYEWLLMKKESN